MGNKPSAFIGIEEVSRRVNRKKSVIYAKMKTGNFPRKYTNGWLEAEIEAYIQGIVRAATGANDDHADSAA